MQLLKPIQSVLFIFLFSFPIHSQNTFWKVMDMSGDDDEKPYAMEVRNDTVIMIGMGSCDGANCMHYYKFTIDGELLLFRDYPGITPDREVSFLDSIFYLPVKFRDDPDLGTDGFRLAKFNLDGDMIQTAKYQLSDHENAPEFDDDFYYTYGCINYAEHIVVYGEILDVEGDDQTRQTCMFWYKEKDLSLDTIIFIDFKDEVFDTWDAAIDKNGLLTLLVEHREYDQNGDEIDHLVYAKYDEKGDYVSNWDGPPWSGRLAHNTFLITDSNDIAMTYEDDGFFPKRSVMYINEAGEIQWQEVLGLNTVLIGQRSIIQLKKLVDGNIIGCGRAASAIALWDASYIFKLNNDTGEMIWDRGYTHWRQLTPSPQTAKYSFLMDMEELDDGSIFVCGFLDRWEVVNGQRTSISDLLLMRLDADGCLEPGCGGTKHHLAGVPVYDHLITEESQWYIQQNSTKPEVSKHAVRLADAADSLYLEGVDFESLDPRECFYTNFITPLYSIREGGKKIYLGENEEELLYDFDLEVGDIFETTYTEYPLQVIESDTMRLDNRDKQRYWVLACTDNPENTITWIENIGTYYGLRWPRNFCEGDYGDEKLTCFFRFERFAHMNPDVEDCFLPTSSSDLSLQQLSGIKAYPNPTSNQLTIRSADLLIERIDILDPQGQSYQYYYEKEYNIQFDMSSYPSGLYFLSIYTAKGSVVKKVIVE